MGYVYLFYTPKLSPLCPFLLFLSFGSLRKLVLSVWEKIKGKWSHQLVIPCDFRRLQRALSLELKLSGTLIQARTMLYKYQHRPGVEKYRSLCSALPRDWTFLRVRSAQDMESRPVWCGVGLAMVASAKGFFAVYDGAVYLPPQARKWFAAFDERGAGDGKPSFRKTG